MKGGGYLPSRPPGGTGGPSSGNAGGGEGKDGPGFSGAGKGRDGPGSSGIAPQEGKGSGDPGSSGDFITGPPRPTLLPRAPSVGSPEAEFPFWRVIAMKDGAEKCFWGVSFLQRHKNEKLYETLQNAFHKWVAFQEPRPIATGASSSGPVCSSRPSEGSMAANSSGGSSSSGATDPPWHVDAWSQVQILAG